MYNAVFILCLYFVSFVSFVECRRFLKKQTKMEKKNFVRNDDAGQMIMSCAFFLSSLACGGGFLSPRDAHLSWIELRSRAANLFQD